MTESDFCLESKSQTMNSWLRFQVVDLEGRFLRWRGETAFDALLHSWHQDAVPELLPTLPGVVDRHDRPAASRRAGRMEDLALRQAFLLGCTAAIDASYCSFVPPGKMCTIPNAIVVSPFRLKDRLRRPFSLTFLVYLRGSEKEYSEDYIFLEESMYFVLANSRNLMGPIGCLPGGEKA